jgi:membrane fusion protein (multidrug efflux system)
MAPEQPQTAASPSTESRPVENGTKGAAGNGEGRRKSLTAVLALGIVIIIGAVSYYLYSRNYESTDDAQVSGHLNGITARVDGTVTAIHVEENQTVQAGQLIAELDSRDFQVALEQAQAQLQKAQADLQGGTPAVAITQTTSRTDITSSEADTVGAQAALASAEQTYAAAQAQLTEAEANNAKAQADVIRYKALVDKEEVAHSDYDQIVATAKALAAAVDSAQSSAAAAQKNVEQRRAMLDQSRSRMSQAAVSAPNQILISRANRAALEAEVQARKADVDQATLDLSYCKIIAPVAGVVTNRTVEVGEHVSKGQRLATVAELGDLWVTANFKESQLRRMHTGQSVKISIDAFGQTLEGSVEAMPGATGSITSLLPPENASGNYVKVVQRLPVRIRLNPGQQGLDRLRPGMSVVPSVSLN